MKVASALHLLYNTAFMEILYDPKIQTFCLRQASSRSSGIKILQLASSPFSAHNTLDSRILRQNWRAVDPYDIDMINHTYLGRYI
jgi:hypothetical protein